MEVTSGSKLLFLQIVLVVLLLHCADSADCGRRKIKLQQLVTHGYTTYPGEFPWHAALFMAAGFKKSYICGGSLVNELSIVTAAHCVTDSATGLVVSPATLYVQLGKFKLNLLSDTVQEHAVQQVVVHNDFQLATSKYDIAILKLATQAKYTDYVQPICVFPQPVVNYNDGSNRGVSVGWGYTEFDTLSDALRGTTMPLVGHTKCLESNPDLFDRTIYDGMFCAGHRNGTNVCNGDSGGGMYFNHNNVWHLIGIVSFTSAREVDTNLCSTKDYTGFTKVSAFEDFIVSTCGLQATTAGTTKRPSNEAAKKKHYYISDFAIDSKVNWFQAGDHCRSMGQHLAEIRSEQENTKVKEVISKAGMEIDANGVAHWKQFWIGANDLGVNGVFRWQFSGRSLSFTNWRHDEPNNRNNNEHCVTILGNKHAFWVDVNCKGRRQVICEVWK
ncbi:chymotrypsinogen A-like [Topomyia yanbarensis]|uniref:chymotrypsinogen A-like n=1 Tax=Topomyia yanbarensis TaxID=2498891 RepID=UPI00273B23BA|nr:chymotrypsinogen A-like [Topomyia yanbarensis]